MTTTTTSLAAFLLARYAEDEAVAKSAREHEYLSPARDASPLRWTKDHLGYGAIFVNSGRVLADIEAKRRIVKRHSSCDDVSYGDDSTCPDMRDLALPYADHPDFNPDWR